MIELNVEALQGQVSSLKDIEAAELLDKALRAVATGNEFYFGNNSHLVIPVLVMLGHRDLSRADSVIDFGYGRHESSYREWIRDTVHKDVHAVQRRRALEAMTREEREAQLVLASLMSNGKPQDDAEQVALVLARLKDDPAHACDLATRWWDGSYIFDEPMGELLEACWQNHPDGLRLLLDRWRGNRREELVRFWVERLLPMPTEWARNQLVLLIGVMQGGHYIDRSLLFQITKALEEWPGEARASALEVIAPLWERVFPNLYRSGGIDAVEVFLQLWSYDSSEAARARLDNLLATRESQHRLPDARRIKRALKLQGDIGAHFGYTLHAAAILCRRGKKLHDYLNRKYIRPDHRRLWRSFLRGEKLIRSLPDDVLRERLLREYAVIAKDTRRARKGAILAALETDTDEPICVVPAKKKAG
ncbi:MAG: hypothetical protein QM758_23690 [Armatimonas sp.]